MNKSGTNHVMPLPVQPAPRLPSPTMYLVRLRSHLSRGKVALGQVMEAVSDVLPRPLRKD